MKLNKIIMMVVLSSGLLFSAAREQMNVNFKDLKIIDLLKITSKIINKNILISNKINGKVDFISNKPIYKDDILNILIYVLEGKGYTIVDNNDILRVVKISDVAKYNAPVYSDTKDLKTPQMITEVFLVDYSNVDYISSKIRHLISKSAKLVTDKNSNAIVLTDFLDNIKTVKKIISIISADSKKMIKVVDLKNIQGSAVLADLKSVAKTVFNEKILKEKVSVLLNKDTNAIMFVGKKENVEFLVDHLKKIDKKGSLVEKVVEVVYLKNAESKSVIKILNGIVSSRYTKEKIKDKPFVSVDEESNSIILMGAKDEIKYFSKMIVMLDVERAQVYVKARIMEISEMGLRNVGVKYGLTAGRATSTGLFTMAADFGGMSGSNLILPSGFDLDIGEQKMVTTVKDGITTTAPSTGNIKLQEALALGTTIQLLETNDALEIVSEPSLLCINNQESSIYIGTTKSIQMGTSTDKNGNATPKLERADIGLSLKVKPRITSDNKVLLQLTTKIEEISSKQTNAQPDSFKKELTTTAIVTTGESVILGGYIKNKEQEIVDKVPFLGDIPIIGSLFRNRVKGKDKINLVIIVTPYIVPKSKDLTYIRNQLTQLKMLEDQYTKDLLNTIKESKIRNKIKDLERYEESDVLDEQNEEIDEKIIEYNTEKKEYEEEYKETNSPKFTNKELHEQRIKKIFGN